MIRLCDLRHASSGFALASFVAIATLVSGNTATAQAPPEKIEDQVRAQLSQYGRFVDNPTYGQVWVPTSVPQGWHPYEPCHWVNTKKWGWYFDDKTPWGQIVHHYGRWTHDAQAGWMWVPGSEFSPGWVTWRSNPEWIGWLPTPPDEDVQAKSADAINTAGGWIFVDANKFAQGCSGAAMAKPDQTRAILTQTQFVTEFDIESGIAVVVLPPYIVGPLVEIDFAVAPWPAWFFAQTLIDWNFIWNNFDVVTNVVYVDCPHPFHPPSNTIPALGHVPPPGTSITTGHGGSGPPGGSLTLVPTNPLPTACPDGSPVPASGSCEPTHIAQRPCGIGRTRQADGTCSSLCPPGTTTLPNGTCTLAIPLVPATVPLAGGSGTPGPGQNCMSFGGRAFRDCLTKGGPTNGVGGVAVGNGHVIPVATPLPVATGGDRPHLAPAVSASPPAIAVVVHPAISGDRPAGSSLPSFSAAVATGGGGLRHPTYDPGASAASAPIRLKAASPPISLPSYSATTPLRSNPNPVVLGPGGGGHNIYHPALQTSAPAFAAPHPAIAAAPAMPFRQAPAPAIHAMPMALPGAGMGGAAMGMGARPGGMKP